MQFLKISPSTKLSDVAGFVGDKYVDSVLHLNNVPRVPNVGRVFRDQCKDIAKESDSVDWQRKSAILNTLTEDSDIFEYAALQSDSGWKVFSAKSTFEDMLKMPFNIKLPDSEYVIGNGKQVDSAVYTKAMSSLENPPHFIDPMVFNEYSSLRSSQILDNVLPGSEIFQWFKIPWGEVTLYSSLTKRGVDFPVYPEEVSDGVKANYSQMPDLIYQYEPWQLYTSSGPRQNSYEFDFHRDMWTGDHRDGMANKLIRFCEANCYPMYNGSAVNVPTVTLYIGGQSVITGVMNDVSVNWDGPLGLDNWYLHCKLTISITEVSRQPLDFDVVANKPLIG